MGEDGLVELSDAIGVVREQLVAAQLAGRRVVAGRVLTFGVGKVSVEFSGEMKTVRETIGELVTSYGVSRVTICRALNAPDESIPT